MELKRYRTLALEIFKTLNVLNPTNMQDLFYLGSSTARRPNNIPSRCKNKYKHGPMERKALDQWDVRSGIIYQNI